MKKEFPKLAALLAKTKEFPKSDGYHVFKKENGFEIVWQERETVYDGNFFKTQEEAEQFLGNI